MIWLEGRYLCAYLSKTCFVHKGGLYCQLKLLDGFFSNKISLMINYMVCLEGCVSDSDLKCCFINTLPTCL